MLPRLLALLSVSAGAPLSDPVSGCCVHTFSVLVSPDLEAVCDRRDQYRKCANLVEAVHQLMEYFQQYEAIPKVQVTRSESSGIRGTHGRGLGLGLPLEVSGAGSMRSSTMDDTCAVLPSAFR